MTKNRPKLYQLPSHHQRSISLKTEGDGLWEDDLELATGSDIFNLSHFPIQPQLRDHIYITTPSGFERGLDLPTYPILGIILPRKRVNVLFMDNILAFVLHDVRDIKDYELDPTRNIKVNSRRNFRSRLNRILTDFSWSSQDNVASMESLASSPSHETSYRKRLKRASFDFPFTQSVSLSNSIGLEDVVMNAEYIPHQDAVEMFLHKKGYNFYSFFSVSAYE